MYRMINSEVDTSSECDGCHIVDVSRLPPCLPHELGDHQLAADVLKDICASHGYNISNFTPGIFNF